MNRDEIKKKIESSTDTKVLLDVPMSQYTSMKIGGPAKMFVKVNSVEDLRQILIIAKEESIPIFLLGNGTNVVIKDGGLNKLVVKFEKKDITVSEEDENGNIFVEAYAGAQLKSLTYNLARLGIGPVAHLYGIPATIGGALKMNAGAYDLEMNDIVYETTYMDMDGNLHTVKLDEHKFGYRDSIFQQNRFVAIKTLLKLKRVDKEEELKEALKIMGMRKERQPLDYPNSGSMFKRGEDFFASKEIDDAGLKGKQIGGVAVSEKHGGFLINKDNGTCKDLLELIDYVKDAVFEHSGRKLELEVIIIGEE